MYLPCSHKLKLVVIFLTFVCIYVCMYVCSIVAAPLLAGFVLADSPQSTALFLLGEYLFAECWFGPTLAGAEICMYVCTYVHRVRVSYIVCMNICMFLCICIRRVHIQSCIE